MSKLEFNVAELEHEIEDIRDFASKFLAPEAATRLEQLRYQLAPLRDAGGGSWTIAQDQPLATRQTNQYNKGRGEQVWGEVTAVWELTRVGGRRSNVVALSGIASSRVCIVRSRNGETESVAAWRMEIGDEKSPGCHFHIQLVGAGDEGVFPSWLPVPRLPGFLPTPASALEFVLGELFQDEWIEHVSQSRPTIQSWAALQRRRMQGVMQWQLAEIESKDDLGVPWSLLKRAKPTANLVEAVRG